MKWQPYDGSLNFDYLEIGPDTVSRAKTIYIGASYIVFQAYRALCKSVPDALSLVVRFPPAARNSSDKYVRSCYNQHRGLYLGITSSIWPC